MKLNLPEQINSDRIILKKHTLNKEYIQLLVASINKSREWLGNFLSHFDEPMTFEKEEAFIKMALSEEKEINYAIWNKETNELMGTIGVFNPDNPDSPKKVELGIMIFKQFTGHHYGQAATEALEKALRESGIISIILNIDDRNIRSIKTAENNGYTWNGEVTNLQHHPNSNFRVYRKLLTR